jgi:hypothetical protein
LPDLVDQALPGVAELVLDGAELLGLGDIDGAFDEVAKGLFELGPQLFQECRDARFARGNGVRGRGLRHEGYSLVKDRCGFPPPE